MKMKSKRHHFVNRYIPGKDCHHCDECAGLRGGVRGNNNLIDGVARCDYCHVSPLPEERARQLVGFSISLVRAGKQGLWARTGPFPRTQFHEYLKRRGLA